MISGRALTARDVGEHHFQPDEFACLCNTIVWNLCGASAGSLPSLSERSNVPDQGIDAEWGFDAPEGLPKAMALLSPGWNVFQYKWRDVRGSPASRIRQGLKSKLKGALAKIPRKTDSKLVSYIFFTNIELGKNRDQIVLSIREGAGPDLSDVRVDIVDGPILAAFLNGLPHVRAGFFGQSRVAHWEKAWADHMHQYAGEINDSARFLGRVQELESLSSCLRDSRVRAVMLVGPEQVGKTRLALEVTRSHSHQTVFARRPDSSIIPEFEEMMAGRVAPLLVVEKPDEDVAEKLIYATLAADKGTVVIIGERPLAGFHDSLDARVRTLRVGALTREESEKLLCTAREGLDFSIVSWILNEAGGLPGLLLQAARSGPDLRQSGTDLVEAIGEGLECQIRRNWSDQVVETLKLLSLMSSVGVRPPREKELRAVCSRFSDESGLNALMNSMEALRAAGLVSLDGPYVEVRPPLLANRLALSLVRERADKLAALLGDLDPGAVRRLFRRLTQLPPSELASFWSIVFERDGLLSDLGTALDHHELLKLVASVQPMRVLALLSDAAGHSHEKRGLVAANEQRIVWIVEPIISQQSSCTEAIRCMGRLSELTETPDGPLVQALLACFTPLHPQVPLALQERLELLCELASPESPVKVRILAAKAAADAMDLRGFFMLRPSRGHRPLDARPPLTSDEILEYLRGAMDLMIGLAQVAEPAVAEAARVVLPNALYHYALAYPTGQWLAPIRQLAALVVENKVQMDETEFVNALDWIRQFLRREMEDASLEVRGKLMEAVEELNVIEEQLLRDDFSVRLKRWFGKTSFDDSDHVKAEDGSMVCRYVVEMRRCVTEAAHRPSLVDESLMAWLLSAKAETSGRFFWALGEMDERHLWVERITKVGRTREGSGAFATYCGGLGSASPAFVDGLLDGLATEGQVLPESILYATVKLPGNDRQLARLAKLVEAGRVSSSQVEAASRFTAHDWVGRLPDPEFFKLVRLCAGRRIEDSAGAVKLLSLRLDRKLPLTAELEALAWRCLEKAAARQSLTPYDCENLASHLVVSDIERGFRLLEKSVRSRSRSNPWNPFEDPLRLVFWQTLHSSDSRRAIGVVISAMKHEEIHWSLAQDFREIIDQVADGEILTDFALKGQKEAAAVADLITAAKPGFWPIALTIVAKYPDSKRVKWALGSSAMGAGTVMTGPFSRCYEDYRKRILAVLDDQTTPPSTRPWLRGIERKLKETAESEVRRETEERVNES